MSHEVKETGRLHFLVSSQSRKAEAHSVCLEDWTCSCEDWQHRRQYREAATGRPSLCRHQEAAVDWLVGAGVDPWDLAGRSNDAAIVRQVKAVLSGWVARNEKQIGLDIRAAAVQLWGGAAVERAMAEAERE